MNRFKVFARKHPISGSMCYFVVDIVSCKFTKKRPSYQDLFDCSSILVISKKRADLLCERFNNPVVKTNFEPNIPLPF